MTKKPPSKSATSKPKNTNNKVDKAKGKSGRVLTMARAAQTQLPVAQDPKFQQAVENYQAGLKALQERKFERAKSLFQKVIASGSKELADRAAVHLNTCSQHLESAATSFKTPEEHYDYAVSLMNSGDYDGARGHMEKLLKQHPKADYAVYGLAVLDGLQNRIEDCLRNLQQAIKLNPANRYQARNDSDFSQMADDPRFTELLYPEAEGDSASAAGRS